MQSGPTSDFSQIILSLLSPEDILQMSSGEVLNPDTINYKTCVPVTHGLLCERIFGPTKDYECACGKWSGARSKGIVCDSCGVLVAKNSVRKERWGHISLATPIVNCWYFKQSSNKIATLLGMSSASVNSLVYCTASLIIAPGLLAKKGVKAMDVISQEKLNDFDQNGDIPENNEELKDDDIMKVIIKTGGDAIYYLLKNFDLKKNYEDLHNKMLTSSRSNKASIKTRLKLIKSFLDSENTVLNKPEWMVLKILPVLPPELRPITLVDGTIATVDLNELYKTVIRRNNLLKSALENGACYPDVVINQFKHNLQKAVDSLIDNSKEVISNNSRRLKSLSERIKGKNGLFRQNLLGKRVDYSGRSVITVNPKLKIYECGLPKDMAAELFKPFIIRRLLDRGYAQGSNDAKDIIVRKDPIVYEILEYIVKGYPVLLNRAPTLHKMSIQAFQPKLIESETLQLNPLVCSQFNADFDGDQLGIHVPLTSEAIIEASVLMLSANNLLRSVDGNVCFVPNKEMVLGFYYLTMDVEENKDNIKDTSASKIENKKQTLIFSSYDEIEVAYNNKVVNIYDRILLYRNGDKIHTTVGKTFFNKILPDDFYYVNDVITSSKIKKIVKDICSNYSTNESVTILDKLKEIGFYWAHKSGLSINIDDILIPDDKQKIIDKAFQDVEKINTGFDNGMITDKDRYTQTIDIWNKATLDVKTSLLKMFENDKNKFNSVYLMLKSGARGSEDQIRQLSGMRGLMSKSQKDSQYDSSIIETPILSNFKEGLNVYDYFISTYGGRKGMIDTALKTADAGYLTRKLVDVAQYVVIQSDDCGANNGYPIYKFDVSGNVNSEDFIKKITGRIVAEDIYTYKKEKKIICKGEKITYDIAKEIDANGIQCVYVRSVFTCQCERGLCAKCYGDSLETNDLINKGEAVGIIAAQSIGEPGTQLTLNTFHVGGVASSFMLENYQKTDYDGIVEFENLQYIESKNEKIVINKLCEITIKDSKNDLILAKYAVPYGARLLFDDKATVKKGDILFDWDQYFLNYISPIDGIVEFKNFKDNIEYQLNKDQNCLFIKKIKNYNIAYILIKSKDKSIRFNIYEKSRIMVSDGEKVNVGDTILQIARHITQSSDITGGLPRVTELFEAKKDDDAAIMSEIDGYVTFGHISKKKIEVIVTSINNDFKCIYDVPLSTELLVQDGEFIKTGSLITKGTKNIHNIFSTHGFITACQYLLYELKSVYEMQGVTIADKHFELIINQMFSMVEIIDVGDTDLIAHDIISRNIFQKENEKILNKNIILSNGGSTKYSNYQIISNSELLLENNFLQNKGLETMKTRKVKLASAKVIIQGISKVALNTEGWLSAASFQSTIKVLSNAAIEAKVDNLLGLKENLIVGHKIPCGTNFKEFIDIDVKAVEKNDADVKYKEKSDIKEVEENDVKVKAKSDAAVLKT